MFRFGKKKETSERRAFREEFETTVSQLRTAPDLVQLAVGHSVNIAHSFFAQSFGSVESFMKRPAEERNTYVQKLTIMEVTLREERGDDAASLGFGLFKMWVGTLLANDTELTAKFANELAYFSKKGDLSGEGGAAGPHGGAMTADPDTEMAAVLAEARRHSHSILATHAEELPRLLQDKELWAAIDKGYARALLTSENAVPLAESHGASLRRPHLAMVTIEVLQLLSAVGAVILGFLAFRWWGLLLLVLLPLYVMKSWRSAQLPHLRGRLPKLGALTFGVVSVYLVAQGAPWALCALSLALALVSLCSVLRYSYPLGVVRRTLVEQPQLAPALIDAGVVTLHRASELPEVRNRAF